jgi:uncharacterized protein
MKKNFSPLPVKNVTQDLNDEEIRELDELLAAVPAPWEAMDVVMLDGYLCGLLVQPTPPSKSEWLPPIFGEHETPFHTDVAGWSIAQQERLEALIAQRWAAIEDGLIDQGWFDPIVPGSEEATALTPPFEGLGFWVSGFEWALAHFTALEDKGLPDVPDLLDSLWRHLPEQDETQAAMTQALDQEHPLHTLDGAIEQLVFDVGDLHAVALRERLHVEPIKRESPKIGRNDPCHCGSERKYKHCHGGTEV